MGDQQVVFMSPQAENLEYLYSLVDKISQQMTENKLKRAELLREIDVLVNESNRLSSKKQPQDSNLPVIANFLKQRNVYVKDVTHHSDNQDDVELECLRRQNSLLKAMLRDKCSNNNETLALLKVHEGYLSDVVSLLRRDVLSYHQALIGRCRALYEERVCMLEDEEFRRYMENISDIQELMEISEIFRLLLRLT
ncbi:LANO_0C03202g1_1 [Lachancea nothofagi CBS 11611]|uniref:LANO_0C03202g1_1 n=1 Tax=Lachancea nothofagi CBS 11611 TaxID=1266666 RepID=A0A1G4J671_9SACH|nr:LANO_0C03202g1_1 [Lachancea nothofagi CBS 11611]